MLISAKATLLTIYDPLEIEEEIERLNRIIDDYCGEAARLKVEKIISQSLSSEEVFKHLRPAPMAERILLIRHALMNYDKLALRDIPMGFMPLVLPELFSLRALKTLSSLRAFEGYTSFLSVPAFKLFYQRRAQEVRKDASDRDTFSYIACRPVLDFILAQPASCELARALTEDLLTDKKSFLAHHAKERVMSWELMALKDYYDGDAVIFDNVSEEVKDCFALLGTSAGEIVKAKPLIEGVSSALGKGPQKWLMGALKACSNDFDAFSELFTEANMPVAVKAITQYLNVTPEQYAYLISSRLFKNNDASLLLYSLNRDPLMTRKVYEAIVSRWDMSEIYSNEVTQEKAAVFVQNISGSLGDMSDLHHCTPWFYSEYGDSLPVLPYLRNQQAVEVFEMLKETFRGTMSELIDVCHNV